LPEVLASQEVMMRNRGTANASANQSMMAAAFEKNLRAVDAWLDSKSYIKTLRVPYHEVLSNSEAISQSIADFLAVALNVKAMTQQVDSGLYRNRS
jgi:hypothetical protein